MLSAEVGGDLPRPDDRCDQACFSASPLAPIGVTMLHLSCESSRGEALENHSCGGGSFYEFVSKVEVTNYIGDLVEIPPSPICVFTDDTIT